MIQVRFGVMKLQREILEPCNIFEENGNVMKAGWSRTPVFIRNDEQGRSVAKHCEREICFVNNGEVSLYFAVENFVKEFNIKIAVADLKHGGVICDNINKKLRFSKVELPSNDTNGEFTFEDKGITLKLTNTIDGKFIKCAYREFGGFDDFYCNIFLKKNIDESLSELAPFERNRKYYYFKRFMPCYTAQGAIKVGGIEYSLKEITARAYIDKTRYFKPREHRYQRLSADCMLGGKRFSLNLASRVGDNRYGNENCFFYDGKLEKLSQITVKGTPNRNDRPYYYKGGMSALDIMFKPFTVRGEAMSAKLGNTTVIFGRLYGTINRIDYDKPLELDNAQAHMIFSEF